MVRPVVHSTKHYVQISISLVATVSRNTEFLINSVAVPDKNLATEVEEGASIKAVYVEMWVLGQVADQNFIMTIAKTPSGLTSPSFANLTDLFSWANKKNIFYTTQGLAPNDGVGQPVNIFKGWIKIPKSKQRFGLGDSLVLSLANQGDGNLQYCGFATYKEYT